MSQPGITRKVWCSACCAAVDAVVKYEAAVVGTFLGAALGVSHGLSQRRASFAEVALKAALGAGVGFLAENVVAPKVKQLVCKDCGCPHLSELPS